MSIGLGRCGDRQRGVRRPEEGRQRRDRSGAVGRWRPARRRAGRQRRRVPSGAAESRERWSPGPHYRRARRPHQGSEWHHCMAASTPSRAMCSTVSAAPRRRRRAARGPPWAGGSGRAPPLARALGGLPTPMRTRTKSVVCRCDCRERSPLWPASPPPALTRTVPGGRSSSSCTTTMEDGSAMPNRWPGHARPAPIRSCRWSEWPAPPSYRRGRRRRRGACSPFSALSDAPARVASRSTVSAPTLCSVPANSLPGLPNPTTSRSAEAPRRSERGKMRRRT